MDLPFFSDHCIEELTLSSNFQLTDELSQTVQAPSGRHGSSTRAQDQALERSIDDLRRGMDVLEAFSSQASALAQWWDWVKVETGSQRQGEPQLAFNCESLKDSTVIARWKLLKNQFVAYSHMVRSQSYRWLESY